MQYVLVGPNQGKTMRLGGFNFKDGVVEIPNEAKDAQSLLSQFYSAHPAHLIQEENGVLTAVQHTEQVQSLAFVPKPLDGQQQQQHSQGGTDVPVALDTLKLSELQAKATGLGLSGSGTKADLVVRIQEHLDNKK